MGLGTSEVESIKEESRCAAWLWALTSFLGPDEHFDPSGYEMVSSSYMWYGLQDSLQTRADRTGANNG